MANEMTGVAVGIYYSIGPVKPIDDAGWTRLGMARGKEFGSEWETVDSTADTSPAQVRTNLVTFKKFEVPTDGVLSIDEMNGHDELEMHVNQPSGLQPDGWVKVVRPKSPVGGTDQIRKYVLPVVFTSFKISAPYDDVVTWNMAVLPTGGVEITDKALAP